MTMGDMKCDVCGVNPPVGVASSALTAMSFAFCVDCLRQGAEAEMVLAYILYINNGQKDINPEVSSWLHTYKDGKYLTWAEWVDQYGSKMDLEADFGGPYNKEEEDADEVHRGDKR